MNARQSERIWFTTADGCKLAAILDRPAAEHYGVIVFAHCFTCSKDLKSIVRLSRRLVDLGWLTCRFDFRGIGQSDGDFSRTNFSTNLEDLRFACRGLQAMGHQVDFLFGHSFGGVASIAAAAEMNLHDGTSVRGVVTLAAPSNTSHLADILMLKNPAIERDGMGRVEIGGKSFEITTEMLNDFRNSQFAERLLNARKTSHIPTLLLHSLQDETVSYTHARELFELLRKMPSDTAFADVSLVTLQGSDHLISNQLRDLEIISNLINNWCLQRS